MEGVLPDALCGRIIRNVMAPHYRNGDYDGGTVAAVSAVADILSKPDAVDEVMSKYANDSRADRLNEGEDEDLFGMLAVYWIIMLGVALCIVGYNVFSSKSFSP